MKATLDALYFNGFIDQETSGVLDDVERLFEGSARDQAEADLDVLTLGTDADTYEFVDPKQGQLTVKILANSSDEPVMAIASVKFKATAEDENGAFTSIISTGSYYLQPSGGAWRIIAFRVERGDELTEAPTESVGGSVSPEPSS